MISKIVPVTLLTGYLGSGKTTLLNHVLNNKNGLKAAVIVNDIGEVNIDETLIQKENNTLDTIIPLSNGCICCTLRKDMVNQIKGLILTEKYDHIVIEASGICEPPPIANAISHLEGARLDNIITIVDALRLADEFGCGEKLVTSFDETHHIEHKEGSNTAHADDIERLLVQQIEFCSTIILNKTDTVTKEQLETVKSALHHLQPDAEILETVYGKIALSKILDTNIFDFDTVYKSAGWIHALAESESEDSKPEADEFGIQTYVYTRKKPFNQKLFNKWVDKIPVELIRSKGIVWFSNTKERSWIFEQSGKETMTREFGRWSGGDEMIKLVFIGRKVDQKKLAADLDTCLEKAAF